MRQLTSDGWTIDVQRNGKITEVKKGGYGICYELGRNNFELVTPPCPSTCPDAFDNHNKALENLIRAGKDCGATALKTSYDECSDDTLIEPDMRDEIWRQLDGPALFGLAHIACVHFNIDLASIEEGMGWISALSAFYERTPGWPAEANRKIWEYYIEHSLAGYEPGRYGLPPSSTFGDYVETLSSHKVVMNGTNGTLQIAQPARPFRDCEQINIDLFLRSVWWWFRLRVRNGRLVLEVRDVPRSMPVEDSWQQIKKVIDL
jgi:hypothetical protein